MLCVIPVINLQRYRLWVTVSGEPTHLQEDVLPVDILGNNTSRVVIFGSTRELNKLPADNPVTWQIILDWQ